DRAGRDRAVQGDRLRALVGAGQRAGPPVPRLVRGDGPGPAGRQAEPGGGHQPAPEPAANAATTAASAEGPHPVALAASLATRRTAVYHHTLHRLFILPTPGGHSMPSVHCPNCRVKLTL